MIILKWKEKKKKKEKKKENKRFNFLSNWQLTVLHMYHPVILYQLDRYPGKQLHIYITACVLSTRSHRCTARRRTNKKNH